MPRRPPTRELLTTEEAARLLGVSVSFLKHARADGRTDVPPHVYVGRSVRYSRATLLAYARGEANGS